jgi:toxin HigB-1
MIESFRSKALAELWERDRTRGIEARLHRRILVRLMALDSAARPEDMNVPGFNFHALRGYRPTRYTTHVNGPWCITFEMADGNALQVDFEQYH